MVIQINSESDFQSVADDFLSHINTNDQKAEDTLRKIADNVSGRYQLNLQVRKDLVELLSEGTTRQKILDILKDVRSNLLSILNEGQRLGDKAKRLTKDFTWSIESVLVSNEVFNSEFKNIQKTLVLNESRQQISDPDLNDYVGNGGIFDSFWKHFSDHHEHRTYREKLTNTYINFYKGTTNSGVIDYQIDGFLTSQEHKEFLERCVNQYETFLSDIVLTKTGRGAERSENVDLDARVENGQLVIEMDETKLLRGSGAVTVSDVQNEDGILVLKSGSNVLTPKSKRKGKKREILLERGDIEKIDPDAGITLEENVGYKLQYQLPGAKSPFEVKSDKKEPITVTMDPTKISALKDLLEGQPLSPSILSVAGKPYKGTTVTVDSLPVEIQVEDQTKGKTIVLVDGKEVISEETTASINAFSLTDEVLSYGKTFTVAFVNENNKKVKSDPTILTLQVEKEKPLPYATTTSPANGSTVDTDTVDFSGSIDQVLQPGDEVRVRYGSVGKAGKLAKATVNRTTKTRSLPGRRFSASGQKEITVWVKSNGKEGEQYFSTFQYEKPETLSPPSAIITTPHTDGGVVLKNNVLVAGEFTGAPLKSSDKVIIRVMEQSENHAYVAGASENIEATITPDQTGRSIAGVDLHSEGNKRIKARVVRGGKAIGKEHAVTFEYKEEEKKVASLSIDSLNLPITSEIVSIEGAGVAGRSMEVVVYGGRPQPVTVGPDGRWQTVISMSGIAANTPFPVTVRMGDGSGRWLPDVTRQAYHTYEAPAASPEGVSIESLNLPITSEIVSIEGAGVARRNMQVVVNGGAPQPVTVGPDGRWQTVISMSGIAANTPFPVTVRMDDGSGGWLPDVTRQAYHTYEAPAANPEGVSIAPLELPITSEIVSLEGAGVARRNMQVVVNGGAPQPVTVGPDGRWQTVISMSGIAANTPFPVTVRMDDGSGGWLPDVTRQAYHTYEVSNSIEFEVTDPPLPITSQTVPLSGRGEIGHDIEIRVAGAIGSPFRATVGPDGNWQTIANLEGVPFRTPFDVQIEMTDPVSGTVRTINRTYNHERRPAANIAITGPDTSNTVRGQTIPLTGTGIPGRDIQIWRTNLDGTTVLVDTVTVQYDGSWQLNAPITETGVIGFEARMLPRRIAGGITEPQESINKSYMCEIPYNLPNVIFQPAVNVQPYGNYQFPEMITIPLDGNPERLPVTLSPGVRININNGGWTDTVPAGIQRGSVIAVQMEAPGGFQERSTGVLRIGDKDYTLDVTTSNHGAVRLDRTSYTTGTNRQTITGQCPVGTEMVRIVRLNQDGSRGGVVGEQQIGGLNARRAGTKWYRPRALLNGQRFAVDVADLAAGLGTYQVVALRRNAAGDLVEGGPVNVTIEYQERIPLPDIDEITSESLQKDPLVITGQHALPGQIITVADRKGTKIGRAQAGSDGKWRMQISGDKLRKGKNTLRFRGRSPHNPKLKSDVVKLNLEYDPLGKDVLSVTSPVQGEAYQGRKVTVSGTAKPGQRVRIYKRNRIGRAKKNTFIEVVADQHGTWTTEMAGLRRGRNVISVRAVGPNGKTTSRIRRMFTMGADAMVRDINQNQRSVGSGSQGVDTSEGGGSRSSGSGDGGGIDGMIGRASDQINRGLSWLTSPVRNAILRYNRNVNAVEKKRIEIGKKITEPGRLVEKKKRA